MPFLPEVPGYVVIEDHTQNSVQVKGGTNWDLSRSAITTPIAPLPDPEPRRPSPPAADCNCELRRAEPKTQYLPEHRMPSHTPAAVLRFAKNSVILSSTSQKALKSQIRAGEDIVVAGHADPSEKNPVRLSLKRAEAAAKQLKKRGVQVAEVKGFGAMLPLTENAARASTNRRVEVFSR